MAVRTVPASISVLEAERCLTVGKPPGLPATEPVATFPVELRDEPSGPAVYIDTTTTLNGVTPQ